MRNEHELRKYIYMLCCIMCTYAKERRKPQKMSIASSRSRSCSIRNRRAISLQSVVSYNSSSSVPNAEIAHYISPMAITHSTSTYISTVQADDEICADHQVLNGHHNREYIHKLLTRISSSVYLFSLYTCTSVRFRGGIRRGWSLGVVVILLFVTRRGVSV